MLYDKRWDAKIKADPLSLKALIVWLEKQPADKKYCYSSTGHCLAAQYNRSIGRTYKVVSLFNPQRRNKFDVHLERLAIQGEHTFGAALERAREALALSGG